MAGRFERKKNGRSSANTPVPSPDSTDAYYGNDTQYTDPNASYDYNQQSYSQEGYQESGYSQNDDSQNGYAGYDENGYPVQGYDDQNGYAQDGYDPYGGGQDPYYEYDEQPEGRGIGWGILSFFLPIVGLILFLVWKNKKPRAAKASGIGALVGFILFLILIIGSVAGAKMYYDHMLDKVNIVEMTKPQYTTAPVEATEGTEETEAPTTEATEAPTTEPPKAVREDFVNFLVVGQAGREGEPERFADTAMIVTLNKFDNSITVTSLLRDAFVQPRNGFRGHNFGHIKLTTVYHLGSHYDHGNPAGSMELMNLTLFDNFGVEIDHNIEISFEVFETVIDCLGGVDIEMDENEVTYMNYVLSKYDWASYNFEIGMNHLDGFSGLAYARMRKAPGDGDSDIKRTIRQRKFMEAVMAKVKSMGISDIQNIANQVLPMVTTNMSKEEITSFMTEMLPKLPTMTFNMGGTCPVQESYWGDMVDIYGDGFKHSVLRFDPVVNKRVMREITLGEVAETK